MYINKSKNLQSYKLSEESSYAVKDKPAVVSAILMELKRSMNIVADKIESTKEWKPSEDDIKLKNRVPKMLFIHTGGSPSLYHYKPLY